MSPNLEIELVAKYPKIYRDYNGDIMATNMAWGMEHDDGWGTLVDCLCKNIQDHIDNSIESVKRYEESENKDSWYKKPEIVSQVIVDQQKEKFGGLRFYCSGGDDIIDGMVTMAESLSYKICENCGHPGSPDENDSWIKTLCKRCRLSLIHI